MPPKKKQKLAVAKARAQRTIERDVLTERKSLPVGEVCGACLLPVEGSDVKVGLVDNCAHVFHFECAERWSQTENSCPQCKQRFFWLAAYSSKGKRLSLSRVQRKDQEGQDDDAFEEIQACEECKEIGDERTLLLCDGMNGTCNAAYHLACVGLREVPRGSWFCPDCIERGFDTDAQGNRGTSRSSGQVLAGGDERTDVREQGVAASADRRDERESESVGRAAPAAGSSSACALDAGGNANASSVTRRRSTAMPSQLRLNALACMTPAVEVPNFQPSGVNHNGNDSGPGNGLFASFVQRRRARQGNAASSASNTGSFIKLNPSYEEDFMGKQTGR